LNANLSNTKHARKAGEAVDFMTTRHVRPAGRQYQDVRKRTCSGCRSEQDEIWRQTKGRTPENDSTMLWKVGYEDADDDEAAHSSAE